MNYKIEVKQFFPASHQLPDTPSLSTKKCMELHGHTYYVICTIESKKLMNGFVVDFGIVKSVINKLDHKHLNDYIEVPTAENIAAYLFKKIKDEVIESNPDAYITELRLAEGYKGETTNWIIVT